MTDVNDYEVKHVAVHKKAVPGFLPWRESQEELPQFNVEIKTLI